MFTYRFKARDIENKIIRGLVEASHQKAAIEKLRADSLYIIEIERYDIKKDESTVLRLLDKFAVLSEKELAVFTRQFAAMLRAGLPIVRILTILSEDRGNESVSRIINAIKTDVEGGLYLSEAFSRYPNFFSEIFISMVRAGELSGTLEDIMDRLASFLEKEVAIKLKVRAAMTYPIIVLIIGFGIGFTMFTTVMPKLLLLFEGMKVQLPLPTKVMIYIYSLFTKREFYYITIPLIGFLGLLLLGYTAYIKTPQGKYEYDLLKMKLPLIGQILTKLAISRFCRTLSTLLNSGIPLIRTFDLIGKTTGNEVMVVICNKVKERLKSGELLGKAFEGFAFFPPMVSHMIAVGEQTGELENLLRHVGDYYEKEAVYIIDALISVLEPVLLVIIGFLIGFIVLAIFMPLYQLLNAVGI